MPRPVFVVRAIVRDADLARVDRQIGLPRQGRPCEWDVGHHAGVAAVQHYSACILQLIERASPIGCPAGGFDPILQS